MGQPVKISDELVEEARRNGKLLHRSIAGQIELWAHLGQAIEPLLEGSRITALRKAGAGGRVSRLLETVNTAEGARRLKAQLARGPYPRYEAVPGRPGRLLRTDATGKKAVGRFAGGRFVPSA